MKRSLICTLTLAACFGMSLNMCAAQSISMKIVPAFAPNGRPGITSPSWTAYVNNATNALYLGVSSVGNRLADPTAYLAASGPLTPLHMIYTDFNSWEGMADPNPNFAGWGAAFQAETGNNIQFGLHIQSSDPNDVFSLQDLSWKLDSDDDSNWFDAQGDFSAANYSITRVGINYGGDGIRGTGDDITYKNNEAGNLPVHELMYVGVGEGFFASSADGVDNQDAIAQNIRDLLTTAANSTFDLRATYTLGSGGSPLIASQGVGIDIPAGMGGDFNFDKDINEEDKDLLTAAISGGGGYDVLFDVNDDGALNFDDLEYVVKDILNTYFGDANCDGEFNSTDLIQIMVAGKYETGNPAVWSSGDFNADGIFESGDLVLALADGGYELGPAAVAAVPEPASMVLSLIGLTLLAVRGRRR
jgi:hypothetical protein